MKTYMIKKTKILAYVILLTFLIILICFIVYSATNNNETDINTKVLTEIEYIEVKLINMSNELNGIVLQNYKVTTNEIEDKSSNDNASQSSEQEGGHQRENSSGQSEETSSNNKSTEVSEDKQSVNKEYNMERINSLEENKEEIKWSEIQQEIEEIYVANPTIELDLYQTNVNKEDISKFVDALDNLSIATKSKEKDKSLEELCNLYDCIVKYAQNVSKDEIYMKTLETKGSMVKALSMMNKNNWEETENKVQEGIDIYSKVVDNTEIEHSKKISINKIYIILNELKNVVKKQDKEIFLTKYKNLLEEMNSIWYN